MNLNLPRDCHCSIPTPSEPTIASSCHAGNGTSIYAFLYLLEALIRSRCEVDDPCGRPTPRFVKKPEEEYDFIVIGGGTAGSVVASRLSEVPKWKVLLIEAGGDEPTGTQIPSISSFLESDIDWKFVTQKEKYACLSNGGRCKWPRGKVLGGTSVIQNMVYVRGNREDYDNWDAMGNTGWSYKDILPYYKKSEDNLEIDRVDRAFHGTGGLLPVAKFNHQPPMAFKILAAAKELGNEIRDLNGNKTQGFCIAQVTSKDGVRYSSARAFLNPARNRTNLHILLNHFATKVLIDPKSKEAYGVEVLNRNNKSIQINARKEVVVSAGTVNSAVILLLSGVGRKKDLKKVGVKTIHDLPGVGKNLHNHVSYTLKFSINERYYNSLNLKAFEAYYLNQTGPMSGNGLSQVTGKITSPYSEKHDLSDIQFYFEGYRATCADNEEDNNSIKRIIEISPTVLNAKSRGSIKLASKNPSDPPLIYANYFSNRRDIKVLIHGIRYANEFSRTKALKELNMTLTNRKVRGCEDHTFDSDAYWECTIKQDTSPEYHQAGTCKMGPHSDPMAVVNHELKVHGIKGLRVMDASIMPVVTSGNTAAPAILIGEKGTDMIKKELLGDDHRY